MSNMSYCRFENTLHNLEDCYDSLQDSGGIESLEKESSEYEKPCIKKLIQLCIDIADEFGDEISELQE